MTLCVVVYISTFRRIVLPFSSESSSLVKVTTRESKVRATESTKKLLITDEYQVRK